MKQGTVTIDINDYDLMLEKNNMVKLNITKEDDKIKVRFDSLKEYIDKQVNIIYPGFKSDYWNALVLTYNKDSNE